MHFELRIFYRGDRYSIIIIIMMMISALFLLFIVPAFGCDDPLASSREGCIGCVAKAAHDSFGTCRCLPPWGGKQCKHCAPNYDDESVEACSVCNTNINDGFWDISTGCQTCLSAFTLESKCTICDDRTSYLLNDRCRCKQPYSGTHCHQCSNRRADPNTGCTTCLGRAVQTESTGGACVCLQPFRGEYCKQCVNAQSHSVLQLHQYLREAPQRSIHQPKLLYMSRQPHRWLLE